VKSDYSKQSVQWIVHSLFFDPLIWNKCLPWSTKVFPCTSPISVPSILPQTHRFLTQNHSNQPNMSPNTPTQNWEAAEAKSSRIPPHAPSLQTPPQSTDSQGRKSLNTKGAAQHANPQTRMQSWQAREAQAVLQTFANASRITKASPPSPQKLLRGEGVRRANFVSMQRRRGREKVRHRLSPRTRK
jgi:hypothetical protein